MTFKKLFIIKDPCKECIVNAACNKDCDKSFKNSIDKINRKRFWRENLPFIIIFGLLLFAILAFIMGW